MARMTVRPIVLDDELVTSFLASVVPHESGCAFLVGHPPHARATRYGRFRGHAANRIALAIRLGRDLAPKRLACHSCDVKGCVNPDHLWEGTHDENTMDASRKGRLNHRNRRPMTAEERIEWGAWLRRCRANREQVQPVEAS